MMEQEKWHVLPDIKYFLKEYYHFLKEYYHKKDMEKIVRSKKSR